MICSWPEFLTLFYRSTMGCLFGCFHLREDRRLPSHLVAVPTPAVTGEPVLNRSRKRLGALLQEKDGLDDSVVHEKTCGVVESDEQVFDAQGLRDEAKFLKACGTLPTTPGEIRESKQSPLDHDSECSKFHSWLPDASFQKLNLDMQHNKPSTLNRYDGWLTESGSLDDTPNSCVISGQNSMRNSISTSDNRDVFNSGTGIEVHGNQAANDQYKKKSVQFHCPLEEPSISSTGYSEISCQSSKASNSAGPESVSMSSPYPTPVQLDYDMQTPGTAFPSYIREMGHDKSPRIRSQYVCSLLNPIENSSQWNMLKDEKSNSSRQSTSLIESLEHADDTSQNSEVGMVPKSVDKDLKVEESLSSWLKPIPANERGNNRRTVSFASEKVYHGKNLGDRPIIGMVAAHWNEDEPSQVPPKWWDGNGIPNSTTKYKEDQKVSWHATPFEERLEKALSEESSISQRKSHSGTPIKFNEKEECDTAISQMKTSAHFNSVISC